MNKTLSQIYHVPRFLFNFFHFVANWQLVMIIIIGTVPSYTFPRLTRLYILLISRYLCTRRIKNVLNKLLFDTFLESESVSIVISGEGFSFVHFIFAYRFSLTVFHSLIFIYSKGFSILSDNFNFLGKFGTSRHLALPGHHQEHITLHHPFPQYNYFIDVTELCLFCIFFSLHTDSISKEVSNKTKYSTREYGRFRSLELYRLQFT
jgi:hypothetical protein